MLNKKSNLKRLHTVWLHLHNILEMTKSQKWKIDQWMPGVKGTEVERKGSGCGYKRATWGIQVVMEMSCIFTAPAATFWLWYYTIGLQDVTIGEGGRYGNPLQYSCLENSMDRRAWWTIVHRIMKSQINWSNLAHMHTPLGNLGKMYMESLCIISYNCMWIYNYLNVKTLNFQNQNKTHRKCHELEEFQHHVQI